MYRVHGLKDLNIVKMSTVIKVIYIFNQILIQIPEVFVDIKSQGHRRGKFMYSGKRTRITNTILKNNIARRLILSDMNFL